MKPVSCDDLRKNWDLLLDGTIAERESEAARGHLEGCEACRGWLREEASLGSALTGWFADPANASASAPPPAPVRTFRRWAGRLATAAAAAALLVLGWAVRPMLDNGGDTGSGALDLRPGGMLVADAAEARDARLPCGSSIRALPGARLEALDGGAVSRVAVRRGSVEIRAAARGLDVAAGALGWLHVDGVATVSDAGSQKEPLLLVTVITGSATVPGSDTPVEVLPGTPHLVGPRGAVRLHDALGRLDDLMADEELIVLTSEQFLEMEGTTESERERLQERIGQLMAENNRLQLENDVLRRGQEAPRVLSPRDLVATLADAVEHRESSGPELWGRVRAVRHLLQDRIPEAEAAIRELLLDPSQPLPRQRLGLNLAGALRLPECGRIVEPWLRHQDRDLREAAVDALSWQRGAEVQERLGSVLREETDVAIRVSAAGGLVRLGDTGEPLQWLMKTYERKDSGPQLRQRILGRVLFAPVQESGRFLVGVLTAPDMDAATAREVIEQIARLGRFGGRRAGDLLDFLAYALPDPALCAYAKRLGSH